MSASNNPCALEVLVVDDDRVVSLLHKNQLRNLSLDKPPVLCSNGKEALDHLQKNDCSAKHFLVFLDLNMPVLDGWKFLKKLKKSNFQAKVFVVIITSSINQKDFLKAQTYDSVIHFCRKPMNADCVTRIKSLTPVRHFFKISTEKPEVRK